MTGPKQVRTTRTAIAAGKLSPCKSFAASRLAARTSRRKRQIAANLHRKLLTAATRLATRKYHRTQVAAHCGKRCGIAQETTPAVDFHEYAACGISSAILSEKLAQCDAILPGVSEAYLKSFEIETQLQALRSAQLAVENFIDDSDTFQF
jgi:hypothetical protein